MLHPIILRAHRRSSGADRSGCGVDEVDCVNGDSVLLGGFCGNEGDFDDQKEFLTPITTRR